MPVVLNVGFDPALLRTAAFSRDSFPDVTEEDIRAGLAATRAAVTQLGLDYEECLLDTGATAAAVFQGALRRRRFDVVVIGAGVRLEPSRTHLLEVLVNSVLELSPGSRLCFNTDPGSTVEAVRRWWPQAAALAEQA